MNDAELSELYTEAVRARARGERESCPPVEALDALVHRRGDDDTRIATLDHVMACASCRHELELLRAIQVATPVKRPAMSRWASLAAAMVLVTGLATWVAVRGTGGGEGASRGDASAIRLIGLAPPAPGEVSRLVWHPLAGATEYQIEVLASDGRVLDTATVTDTSYVLPATIPPTAFDWWVRAPLADGRVVRSPLQRTRR